MQKPVIATILGLGLLGAFGGAAFADEPPKCVIVSINGRDANIVVDLKLKTAALGESKCGLNGLTEAGRVIKAEPAKYCGDQNGGKAEVVWYWGTKDKHKQFKKNQTCPFEVKKGRK